MQRNLYETYQRLQPISTTGVARHILLWAATPLSPATYNNPRTQSGSIHIYCVHGTADLPNAFSLVADRLINPLSDQVIEQLRQRLPEEVVEQLIQPMPDEVASIHLVHFNERLKGVTIESFARQLKDNI